MAQNTKTAAQEGGGHAKVFPPLDPSTFAPQLVWLALTFGLLYLLMRRFILPRVGEVIEERDDRSKRDLAQAEKLKTDIATALASYEHGLAEARAEANAIAKAVHDKVAAEIEKERMKGEAEIAAKLAEGEKRIAEATMRALANVGDIADEVAGAIVARLLGNT
jgi:F-type H+-transporting ATPase subunit b